MVIKQIEAVAAYHTLKGLNETKMPQGKLRLAKNIYDLCRKLEKAWDFYIQERNKIFAEHPDFDPQIMGIPLKDKTEEEKVAIRKEIEQLNKEISELDSMDYELDHTPFEINLDMDPVSLSGEDIGALSSLIHFV